MLNTSEKFPEIKNSKGADPHYEPRKGKESTLAKRYYPWTTFPNNVLWWQHFGSEGLGDSDKNLLG